MDNAGRKDIADSFPAYEAVLLERPKVSERTTVKIYCGTFGNVNFGEQVGTINASANVISDGGSDGAAFAGAIRSIAGAVVESPELDDKQKREALHAIEVLGAQNCRPKKEAVSGEQIQGGRKRSLRVRAYI